MRTKYGFIIGWFQFTWPHRRGARRAAAVRILKHSAIESRREENRMRDMGASESAIWHAVHWVGHPRNSRWRRFCFWMAGDFLMLDLLRKAK